MSGFVTRIDYSTNRQIKQRAYTSTDLSGTTVFGLEYSALTAGVDLETVVTTSTLANVETTFSGNSQETIFDFPDARMVVSSGSLTVITDVNSGDTQNAIAFEGSEFFELDGNIVNTAYTGSSFDLTVTEIVDDGFSGWTGTAINTLVSFLSGSSLDFQERPIWVDVKGITKTGQLIIAYQPNKDNSLQSVLGRTVEGDVVEVDLTQLDTVYEGTYAELQLLIDNNELKVGNKYILTDYKTIYQIENTNSAPINERYTILGPYFYWAVFGAPGIPNTSLKNGDVVTIVELPDGYSGSRYVGQPLTVVDWYNAEYIQFSPETTESGIVIEINNQRYPNVTNNEVILDISGNIVMQPGGVLNIDVHNDLPYMDMSGAQNPSPKIENLVLTAIDINKFSIHGESLTYLGDTVLYYFNDNIIYDENGNQIGTRNGLVKQREAIDLNISVNKDWRTQRYRRWKMDDATWANYILRKPVYQINGANYCTTVNTTMGLGHRYILPKVFNLQFYLDFSSGTDYYGGTDPFLSGTTYAPILQAGGRDSNDLSLEYMVDAELPISGLTSAKDFHILPIIDEQPDDIVDNYKVNNLENTITTTESSVNGLSRSIYFDCKGDLKNSTFMTGCSIISGGGSINEVTSVDNFGINIGSTTLYILKSRMLSFGNVTVNGIIDNCTFGNGGSQKYTKIKIDSGCEIRNSIFGGDRHEVNYSNFYANKGLLIMREGSNNRVTGNIYLTKYSNNIETTQSYVELMTFANTNPAKLGKYGYLYIVTGGINDVYVNNLNGNRNLIYEKSDSLNIITWVTKSTLQ